eukprot:6593367-Lingulodinium_polyedra.AAC.1
MVPGVGGWAKASAAHLAIELIGEFAKRATTSPGSRGCCPQPHEVGAGCVCEAPPPCPACPDVQVTCQPPSSAASHLGAAAVGAWVGFFGSKLSRWRARPAPTSGPRASVESDSDGFGDPGVEAARSRARA